MSIRHNHMTSQKIEKKIAGGDGQGEGKAYRPWLRVGDFANRGRAHRILDNSGRICQLFSDLEQDYYFHLLWQDEITDINEQYPLQPLALTQSIAAECGFVHPRDKVTGTDVVMTTDFYIKARAQDGEIQLARAVKYANELRKPRVKEKLMIEKLYWEKRGIEWKIVTETSINRKEAGNIRYLLARYSDSCVEGLPDQVLPFLARELTRSPYARAEEICAALDETFSAPKGSVLKALYYFGAHKIIPFQMQNCWTACRVDEMIDIDLMKKYISEGFYDEELTGSR